MHGYNPTARQQDRAITNGIIHESIEHIVTGLSNLQAAMHSVDTLRFHDIYLRMEQLEEAFGKKTFIDAAFALLAERADAGRMVSSANPAEYLIKRLGLTYPEAMDRLRNAQTLFGEDVKPDVGPPPTAEPEPEAESEASEDTQDPNFETSAEDVQKRREREERERERLARERAAQEQAEREARERADRENEAKQRNRDKLGTGSIPADVLRMIDYELKNLDRFAQPGEHELREMALNKAREISKSQLKNWLRAEIRKANAKGRMPNGEKDHTAQAQKRKLIIGQPDAEGMVEFSGRLDPVTAALLMKAMSPAARPAFDKDETGYEDNRTLAQRRADQLAILCQNFMTSRHPESGLSSIVVSATRKELENLSADTLLPTDTGIYLTPLDLVRLGAAGSDYLCIMDDKDFQPLALGRSKRTATLAQKIALIASEMVCSHDGCETAAMNCDVHHIIAWSFQGPTDLKNLTLRCRRHHGDNNDARDFRYNMAHATRSPENGRAGTQYPGPGGPKFNESTAAQQSAHHKLKKEAAASSQGPPGGTDPPPDDAQDSLFTPA